MHILDQLKERGILAQVTFEEDLYKAMDKEPMTFYVGIDPTADSLHVGHIVPVILAQPPAAGGAPAHHPVRRRHGHGRRSQRENRAAPDADQGGDRSQRRGDPKADQPL